MEHCGEGQGCVLRNQHGPVGPFVDLSIKTWEAGVRSGERGTSGDNSWHKRCRQCRAECCAILHTMARPPLGHIHRLVGKQGQRVGGEGRGVATLAQALPSVLGCVLCSPSGPMSWPPFRLTLAAVKGKWGQRQGHRVIKESMPMNN
jgi:hypothetical protein